MISTSSPEPMFGVKREREEVRYFAGLDLGQQNDHSALAVLRRTRYMVKFDNHPWRQQKDSIFQCGFLDRYDLGVSYPGIVAHIIELMQKPLWKDNIVLAIDLTGVGRPVGDIFRSAGVPFVGVNITSGMEERLEGTTAYVPKSQLISHVQAMLHEQRLHIHSDLKLAFDLKKELENFQVRYTDGGRMTYGAKGSGHDDMTLALSIALWRAHARERQPVILTKMNMAR